MGQELAEAVGNGDVKMKILKNLAALVKVKTIVTLVVMAVFAVLALSGDISADNAMIIISMVVSFYFGTQHEKKVGDGS